MHDALKISPATHEWRSNIDPPLANQSIRPEALPHQQRTAEKMGTPYHYWCLMILLVARAAAIL
jgi:hypothetical protein